MLHWTAFCMLLSDNYHYHQSLHFFMNRFMLLPKLTRWIFCVCFWNSCYFFVWNFKSPLKNSVSMMGNDVLETIGLDFKFVKFLYEHAGVPLDIPEGESMRFCECLSGAHDTPKVHQLGTRHVALGSGSDHRTLLSLRTTRQKTSNNW